MCTALPRAALESESQCIQVLLWAEYGYTIASSVDPCDLELLLEVARMELEKSKLSEFLHERLSVPTPGHQALALWCQHGLSPCLVFVAVSKKC